MNIDETRRQILAADGHLLIQGGPGCGKTTIALLKAASVVERLEPEQRVLFLSFSRAAVRQVGDRRRGLLPRAVRDRLEVRTFHSFFLDLVRAHGSLLTGKPSTFIAPDRERQLRADFDGDWTAETHRLARDDGRYVFDRLAGAAASLLAHPAIRALYCDVYPLVIVDEFQDTSDDQWQAVRELSRDSVLVCLADPDQRIFGFVEGVHDKRIEHAIEDLGPSPFDLSDDNHRSAGTGLLDYANAVLRNDPSVPVPDTVVTATYPAFVKCEVRAHEIILALRDHLERRLGRTPTIAVLTRTNNQVVWISETIAADRAAPSGQGKRLPAVDHELNWDPELAAAAGYVVASIMEWPGLSRFLAVTSTLRAIADFYRIKFSGGTIGARKTVDKIEKAITAIESGAAVRPNTAKIITSAYDAGIHLDGEPVSDWQAARACLHGTDELDEISTRARLLRLFKATDALAWALLDIWDGQSAYTNAAQTVRRVLVNQTLELTQSEPVPVTLMNMHKSKGKEFDGVIIVEGRYSAPLVDPTRSASDIADARRVLRVAITRARHIVVLVRPSGATPLTG